MAAEGYGNDEMIMREGGVFILKEDAHSGKCLTAIPTTSTSTCTDPTLIYGTTADNRYVMLTAPTVTDAAMSTLEVGHLLSPSAQLDVYCPAHDVAELARRCVQYIEEATPVANTVLWYNEGIFWCCARTQLAAGTVLTRYKPLVHWLWPLLQEHIAQRNLTEAQRVEDLLFDMLPFEADVLRHAGIPCIGLKNWVRRLPPPIKVVKGDDGEIRLGIPVSSNRKPTTEECRQAIRWAGGDSVTGDPYATLLRAMTEI